MSSVLVCFHGQFGCYTKQVLCYVCVKYNPDPTWQLGVIYDPDTDFWYVCTMILTLEVWPWVKVMTHPWVMDNNQFLSFFLTVIHICKDMSILISFSPHFVLFAYFKKPCHLCISYFSKESTSYFWTYCCWVIYPVANKNSMLQKRAVLLISTALCTGTKHTG